MSRYAEGNLRNEGIDGKSKMREKFNGWYTVCMYIRTMDKNGAFAMPWQEESE
jgi:hypothetical protein